MSVVYNQSRLEMNPQNNWGNNWLLVWALDASGNTSSMTRPNIVRNSPGAQSYTYSTLTTYRSAWSEVMFTSNLYPSIRWIFTRSAKSTNLPLILQALLAGGNPATYLTVNTEYAVTLDTARSSVPISGTASLQFMHNWAAGEAGDIPTLGRPGGYVWSTGMYWGNIDAYSNYGGLMNRTTPQSGSSGGNTGDRLLVYVR